jgi:DNA-binding GntR family transcriptional regulator
MTQGRDAFGKVAQQLRTDLRDGVLAPGTPLVVLDLAKRLRVSPTPVREALSRLSGQGLVEEHRGRGFIAARRRAVDLIELHRLHDGLIATALEQRSAKAADGGPILVDASSAADGRSDEQLRALTEALWRAIVGLCGNRALETAHGQLQDQLAVARLVERGVFRDLGGELAGLVRLFELKDYAGLKTAARRYHRRRCEAATALAHAIRDTFGG